MNDEIRSRYNRFLENLSDKLDIPPSKYQQAVERYQAVGKWLNEGEYEGSNGFPSIYPQGSFRLGTVVRPLRDGKEADYDIDLVCRLAFAKGIIIPEKLKYMVGQRLKENGRYKPMLGKEGKRCWTLHYAEADGIGFHMDILPAAYEKAEFIQALVQSGIPEHLAIEAIAITHKDRGEYAWLSSNPPDTPNGLTVSNRRHSNGSREGRNNSFWKALMPYTPVSMPFPINWFGLRCSGQSRS